MYGHKCADLEGGGVQTSVENSNLINITKKKAGLNEIYKIVLKSH